MFQCELQQSSKCYFNAAANIGCKSGGGLLALLILCKRIVLLIQTLYEWLCLQDSFRSLSWTMTSRRAVLLMIKQICWQAIFCCTWKAAEEDSGQQSIAPQTEFKPLFFLQNLQFRKVYVLGIFKGIKYIYFLSSQFAFDRSWTYKSGKFSWKCKKGKKINSSKIVRYNIYILYIYIYTDHIYMFIYIYSTYI